MSKQALYICYFGVREPLVQTQVIPYLLELGKDDIKVSLLTFEPDLKRKWTWEQIETQRKKLAEKGITWSCLAYHKRPSALATAYDVFRGAWAIRQMISREKIDILHGRVHIPTLMGGLARGDSRRNRPKLLFDIRGFFPEEYTDAGVWPEGGLMYRTAKRVERWLLKEADGFVVLTEKAREILFPGSKETGFERFGRPVEVIPCCVDLTRFETATPETRLSIRKSLGIEDRFVMTYIGAFGGWYLTVETADLYGELKLKDPTAFALILTQSRPEMIEPLLKERGYADGDYLIKRVPSEEIPAYLSVADIAVSFIKPCFSKRASSPTKNAEYLACGLAILANDGIGDVDRLIDENGIGGLITSFEPESYRSALKNIEKLGDIGDRCRGVANAEFDLVDIGGTRYRRIYRRLLR